MGSHDAARKKQGGILNLVRLVGLALAVAAAVKELRTPPAQRTWNGVVAGFVPYDLRMPTVARVRQRMWAPDSEHLISPRVFGVGWTLNVGRLVALVRQNIREA
jgi:hypothetical protein